MASPIAVACVVTPRGGAPPADTDGRTGRQPGRVGQTPRTPDRPAGLRVHARATTSQDEHTYVVVLQHLFVNVC